ncbi:MAG TPA: hypothetical protein VML19_20570 [Verrucomicrobiae bacterium]|nr:hypothetical protein [Verrucomicrobiae bacterium]
MRWRTVAPGMVALLDPAVQALVDAAAPRLVCELEAGPAAIVLLAWQPPPGRIARDDGPVHSFVCSPSVRDRLLAAHPDAPPESLCCLLLEALLDGSIGLDRLLVRQLPLPDADTEPAPVDPVPTALIMAHRGSVDHLRVALRYIAAGADRGLVTRVGLDTGEVEPYRALASSLDRLQFFQGHPAPAGPYVIRQKLAELSPEPFLLFHDSDDLSTSDRLARLRAAFASTDCGLIGCHELLVDEIADEVRAIRYPLDVTAALRDGPHYCLLHPTSMVSRAAFFSAGGFSTDRVISQDTQFHFRAWFHMRMQNLDRFLYVRRKHAASLTTHPATAIGSEFRRAIERPWFPDFEAVKSGRLTLGESTLAAASRPSDHRLVPLA